MAFSNRDKIELANIVTNQKGQGVIEYVLVLIVSVALILGGVYQLNSAFKTWATNYFGNYLACLLETGELPTIGGSPGDSGLCNQIFKPFSLADGRPLVDGYKAPDAGNEGGQQGGARERELAGGGGGGSSYQGTPFRSSITWRGGSQGPNRMRPPTETGSKTGDNRTGDYGSYGRLNRRLRTDPITRLDKKFAFEGKKDPKQKSRSPNLVKKADSEKTQRQKRITINPNDFKKDRPAAPDSSFTISDFIRFLIIAAIIVALVMFLGGQALKIGKSME